MFFQVGDVVQLNSGGPEMTVSFVGEKKFSHGNVLVVQCKWFEGNKFTNDVFLPEVLRKVKNQPEK